MSTCEPRAFGRAVASRRRGPRDARPSVRSTAVGAALMLALASPAGAARAADMPHFGQPISPTDAAAWDISIGPDGAGLPPGSGTPAQGAVVYAQKCAAC